MRELWTLDPSFTFLNHGSFGACPKAVLDVQAALRAQLESQPLRFFVREAEPLIDRARRALSEFIGADPEGLVFVRCATEGANTVLERLPLEPGDALLTTDHAYASCKAALDYKAERAGAEVIVAKVPFPLQSPEQVVAAVLGAATPRVKLALIDHVTSPTGLVFPIAEIVRRLAERGIETLVDGAHVAGMLPLDVRSIGAAYYTGNCHKWLCTPKGSAFLWVRADRRDALRPLSIGHGFRSKNPMSRLLREFDWPGTHDPTAILSIPAALEHLGSRLPGGWPELMQKNHALALEARALLASALEVPIPAPESMIGSLASLPLPGSEPSGAAAIDPVQDALFHEHRIEVPIFPWPTPGRRLMRISAQLYNRRADYERLAAALPSLLH